MHQTWPNFRFKRVAPSGGGGGGAVITPVAELSRTSGKAGLAVYFDFSGTTATTTTDPEHELYFAVDFGDERGETFAYGTNTGRSKNIAYGPQVAHTYTEPGVYTPILYVADNYGNAVSALPLSAVTVNAWLESETIYISNGNTPNPATDAGVGYGAAGYYNEATAAGMMSRIAANQGKRILLNRASTWSPTNNTTLSGHTGTHIGSYGTGTLATLTPAITATYTSMLTIENTCSDIRLSEIKINATVVDVVGATALYAHCNNLLLHKCEVTGSQEGIDGTGNDGVFFDSCNFHDLGVGNTSAANGTFYYGVFMSQTTRLAIVGTAIDNVWTGHCARLHPTNRACVHNSTIRKARRGYGSGNGHSLTIRGPENSGTWDGVWTEKILVRECILGDLDDGIEPLQIAPENNNMATRQRNAIVESNIIRSRINSGLISEVCSRLTVRSNIFITSGASQLIRVSYQNSVGTPAPSDTKIYNNTFYKIDASVADAFSAVVLDSGTSGTLIKNNLAYAPGDTRDAYQVGSTPTLVAGAGTYTPANNSSDTQIKTVRPWASTSPAVATDFTPQAGNYAVNGGISVPLQRDFFGATITGTRDIGAIQV